jgi:hypothetical protein
MSRNVRQKYRPAPARAPKRRDYDSSSLDLSDDSGYSGVEDVTDSEDDDEDHVVAAEEEHIITNASRKRSSPPRPLMHHDDDDDDDDADEESEADEEDEAEAEDADPADDSASWDGILSETEDLAPAAPLTSDNLDQLAAAIPVERHVRFAGVPDSDSDSTTSETSEINGFFPDIFVEQSALDPSFRREIENDDETSSNGSFWDFHHNSSQDLGADPRDSDDDVAQDLDLTPLATPRPSQSPSEAATPVAALAEVQELDGYESESARPPWARLVLMLVRQPTAIPPRRTSRSRSSARSRCGAPIRSRRRRIPTRRGAPRTGRASRASAGSTSTGPTTSPSASSTPPRAR